MGRPLLCSPEGGRTGGTLATRPRCSGLRVADALYSTHPHIMGAVVGRTRCPVGTAEDYLLPTSAGVPNLALDLILLHAVAACPPQTLFARAVVDAAVDAAPVPRTAPRSTCCSSTYSTRRPALPVHIGQRCRGRLRAFQRFGRHDLRAVLRCRACGRLSDPSVRATGRHRPLGARADRDGRAPSAAARRASVACVAKERPRGAVVVDHVAEQDWRSGSRVRGW